jgi:hypothetical protein
MSAPSAVVRGKEPEVGDDQEWRTLPDGRRVPIGPKKSSNGAALGAAAAVVLAALAGGGAGTAAAASGAADEFSAGTRTTQSQEADEFSINSKTSRGKVEVRIAGDEDSFRATTRLRRAGGHPTTLDAQSDKSCADHSDGDVQSFFRKHECTTLYRTLIEYKDGNYVIRFLIATIEMPDDGTAADLRALLSTDHTGDIAPLSSKGKSYHDVPFVTGLSSTTLEDTVVTNTRTQAVGSTPRAEALGFLTTSLLFGLR